MENRKPFYIIIGGPTGVGKTKVSIEIAKEFDGEIINADSRQIYRDFNIGTGKPSDEEFSSIPHHLFDILDGRDRFSAYEYMEKASSLIKELVKRKKVPIVVGGTGLYIRSLLYGLFPEGERDEDLRKKIVEEGESRGWDYLYSKLKEIDKDYAEKINSNDKIRIIRALEVYYKTGRTITENFKSTQTPLKDFYPIKIFLNEKRSILYEKINRRVEKMFEMGLLEEITSLLKRGYDEKAPAFQSIGYKYGLMYLEGKIELEEAIKKMQRDTRHYAKRQIVWFKKEKGFQHFNPKPVEKIIEFIKKEIRWKELSL